MNIFNMDNEKDICYGMKGKKDCVRKTGIRSYKGW